MDWELNAENQKKYDEVTAEVRRLQAEMGIAPMTIEERAADYQRRKEEQARLTARIGNLRPAPKWKI
jgi:outer membrane murein-binding lipoprotein Lpp